MGQNAFHLQNKFYEQIQNTVIGNPLSTFSGEIFVCKFETKFKNIDRNFSKIWVMYVNNIFAVIDQDFKMKVFMKKFNS